jgi:hypothetical protein
MFQQYWLTPQPFWFLLELYQRLSSIHRVVGQHKEDAVFNKILLLEIFGLYISF